MDFPAGVMWADVLTKPLQRTEFRKIRSQLLKCAMEYIDGEESSTKKLKTLIDQESQQDAIQTVQDCVGQYPRSKLCTRRVLNGGLIRGISGRRTGMRIQYKNRRKTDRHANTIKFSRSDVVISMRPSPWYRFYLLI